MTGLIKCPSCGINVPDVDEQSQREEVLCNSCYQRYELAERIGAAIRQWVPFFMVDVTGDGSVIRLKDMELGDEWRLGLVKE